MRSYRWTFTICACALLLQYSHYRVWLKQARWLNLVPPHSEHVPVVPAGPLLAALQAAVTKK